MVINANLESHEYQAISECYLKIRRILSGDFGLAVLLDRFKTIENIKKSSHIPMPPQKTVVKLK